MPTDYAIAVELLLGAGIKYRMARTYAELVATWEDVQAVPSQAALDAAYAPYEAEQTAEIPFLAYLQNLFVNRKAIGKIFMTFSEGFRTAGASPTLAQYRTVLSETLVKIYALPSAFTNEFDTERTALALPALNGAPNYAALLTLAQCQTWHNFLGNWIGRVMAGAAIASAVKA